MSDLDGDYKKLVVDLVSRGYIKNSDKELIDKLKGINLRIYSLSLWEYCLDNLPDRGRYFLQEIRSDAIQSLPLALLGYRKPVALCLRNILENMLKHIYYIDHQIEFMLVQHNQREPLDLPSLIKYSEGHPYIGSIVKRAKVVERIQTEYSDISKSIHGTTIEHMQLAKALESIKFNASFFDNYKEKLYFIANQTNFLIALYHKERFFKLDLDIQRIIFRTLEQNHNRALRGL